MQIRTKFAAPILAAEPLVGWQTATSRSAIGQDKNDPAAVTGTPAVLPRPDFHFPGKDPLPKGPAKLAADFVYDGKPGEFGNGGRLTLSANGTPIAEGWLERTIPIQISLGEGLDVGIDIGSSVDFTYTMPFRFTGKIEKVTIELK
jgi:hypothetical protein